MILKPTTIAELATTLRSASEAGKRVRLLGGGTKQGWGNAITTDVTISTASLDQLREHIWQDMTCTVEAGMKWADLQAALSQHRQFVALDPLFAKDATVGGVLATNDSGARRMKYGSLRDLVIGMTVVLPDGTIAKSGGKVVKNVAGYDLPKLMIGAFGTLGVIAEVTFRLHALPRHTRHFTLAAEAQRLSAKLLELAASQLSLEALQVRDAQYLDVALSAMPEVLEQQRGVLGEFVKADASIWHAREALFAAPVTLLIKASTVPSNIVSVVQQIAAMEGSSVAQSLGLITAALPADADLIPLRKHLEAGQGSLIVLRDPSQANDVWGAEPDSLVLQRLIKHRFDPNRTLNPGIFLGGI